MKFNKTIQAFFLSFLLLAATVQAQQTPPSGVTQSGAVTAGHIAVWNGTGRISDGGASSNILTNTHIYVGNASNVPIDVALSGDCSLLNTGAITCTKTNNVAFAASATTNALNASNISSGTLPTLRLPSPFTSGTASGNTSVFATTNGALINGHYAAIDASGNIVDGGSPCCASGSVASGTAGQLTYYPATNAAVAGNANLNVSSGALTIGVAGTQAGTLLLSGATSGTTTLAVASAASGVLTLPSATDTLIGKATTDTLTNKTYDTAGAGNSFSINGLAATANTGTGAVARATSPVFVSPTLGAATATSLSATNGVVGNTITVSGYGVRITQPNSTDPAILQFTNYARSIQRSSIFASDAGDLTLNPDSGRSVLISTSITPNQTLGVVGTTTNNNAQAGSVGEYKSSEIASGSAVSLTTAVAANVTSLSLEGGDWRVCGNVTFSYGGTTTVARITAAINTTSATLPTLPALGASQTLQTTFTTGAAQALVAGCRRVLTASTISVYLIARSDFAVSTGSAYGFLEAWRVR